MIVIIPAVCHKDEGKGKVSVFLQVETNERSRSGIDLCEQTVVSTSANQFPKGNPEYIHPFSVCCGLTVHMNLIK